MLFRMTKTPYTLRLACSTQCRPRCCTTRYNKIAVGLGGSPTQNDTTSLTALARIGVTKCHKLSDRGRPNYRNKNRDGHARVGSPAKSYKTSQLLCPNSSTSAAPINVESDAFPVTLTHCGALAFVRAVLLQESATIGNDTSPSSVDDSSFKEPRFARFDAARTFATN